MPNSNNQSGIRFEVGAHVCGNEKSFNPARKGQHGIIVAPGLPGRWYVKWSDDGSTTWQKVLKHQARWNQIRWYSGECPTHLIPEAAVQVLHLDIAKDHGTLSYNCNPTELYDNTYVVDSLYDLRNLITKYLDAPAPKRPEHIRWSDLRYAHACSDGLQWFEATFGLNACVEYETLKRLAGERNPTWPDWLDKHFAK